MATALPSVNRFSRNGKTAVIFLTANDLEKDVLKGYDLGSGGLCDQTLSIQIFPGKRRERFMQLISPAKKKGRGRL